MNARLHVRPEYGVYRIHPGYDLETLADLALVWRAARDSASCSLVDLNAAEARLLEYLRLDLIPEDALDLVHELIDSGVTPDAARIYPF